jgi:hypothetical protein
MMMKMLMKMNQMRGWLDFVVDDEKNAENEKFQEER